MCIITEQQYHGEVGSTDNRLWECAVQKSPDLKTGLEAISQQLRSAADRTNRLCREAEHWNALWSERVNIKYDRNRMSRRCARDSSIRKVVRWMRDRGCKAVWFGSAACKAKGHRPVPTKSAMRGIGRFLPVIAGNEWGTSSRCPHCRDGTKLLKQRQARSHSDMEMDGGTAPPLDRMLATPQESNRKQRASDPYPRPRPTGEDRWEQCPVCNRRWGHDEVATINQKMRFSRLISGEPDPHWLCRTVVDLGCASHAEECNNLDTIF